MASARQRRRKHERRVHHQHAQRARLRAALDSAPRVFTLSEMRQHMYESGYEHDHLRGGWLRVLPKREPRPHGRRTWAGIMAKRKAKKRRK
jgi:hypothetical protein